MQTQTTETADAKPIEVTICEKDKHDSSPMSGFVITGSLKSTIEHGMRNVDVPEGTTVHITHFGRQLTVSYMHPTRGDKRLPICSLSQQMISDGFSFRQTQARLRVDQGDMWGSESRRYKWPDDSASLDGKVVDYIEDRLQEVSWSLGRYVADAKREAQATDPFDSWQPTEGQRLDAQKLCVDRVKDRTEAEAHTPHYARSLALDIDRYEHVFVYEKDGTHLLVYLAEGGVVHAQPIELAGDIDVFVPVDDLRQRTLVYRLVDGTRVEANVEEKLERLPTLADEVSKLRLLQAQLKAAQESVDAVCHGEL